MDKRKRRLLCMLEGSGRKSRWVSGAPPLSFKAFAAGELENYRIYGNTVGGESVGDRTGNLFDENWIINDMWYFDNHLLKSVVTNTDSRSWDYNNAQLKFKLNAGTYTITIIPDDIPFNVHSGAAIYSDDNTFICGATYGYNTSHSHTYTFTLNQTTSLGLMFKVYDGSFYIMLNAGSTALPYEPYGYKVPVTVSNGTDTLTTPIYLPEPIKMVGSEAEYVDYYSQTLHRVRKNLLQNTATSKTINGVTFTVNDDGSVDYERIRASSSQSDFYILGGSSLEEEISLPGGTIIFSGGVSTNALIRIVGFGLAGGLDIDSYSSATISSNSGKIILRVKAADNGSGTFYPMIRKADIEDDTYEPYIENTDLDVTLPALSTIKGTNVMSVGTAVQPSEIEIKGKIKAL